MQDIRLTDNNQKIDKAVYHYVSTSLKIQMSDIYNRLWFEYFMRTPFCMPESFEHLFDTANESFRDFARLFTSVPKLYSASMSHERVFFLCPKNVKTVLHFFSRNEKDLLVDATQDNSIEFLAQMMDELHGRKIFIICLNRDAYEKISKYLTAKGFVENEDFFNGTPFLEIGDGQNISLRNSPFISAM